MWSARTYEHMKEPGTLRGTSYLQCGSREEGEPRRYHTFKEWQEHNKVEEELKPLGPVIHT